MSAWAVRSVRTRVRLLESQAASLNAQVEEAASATDRVERRARGLQGRLYREDFGGAGADRRLELNRALERPGQSPEAIQRPERPERDNPYVGIERCDLDALPEPAGEFDPLVLEYLNLPTYSLLSDSESAERMITLARRWTQTRPYGAYERLLDQVFAEEVAKHEARQLEQAKEAFRQDSASFFRMWIERDAVFVACLRQVGFLPPR